MARIYANSLHTIISPASDPNDPLLIERDESLTRPAILRLAPRSGEPSAIVRFHPILPEWNANIGLGIRGIDESGLLAMQPTRTRAWCLQEHELSHRTIIFSSHQFGWLCEGMQCSEEEFTDISRPLVTAINKSKRTWNKHPSTHLERFL